MTRGIDMQTREDVQREIFFTETIADRDRIILGLMNQIDQMEKMIMDKQKDEQILPQKENLACPNPYS